MELAGLQPQSSRTFESRTDLDMFFEAPEFCVAEELGNTASAKRCDSMVAAKLRFLTALLGRFPWLGFSRRRAGAERRRCVWAGWAAHLRAVFCAGANMCLPGVYLV